MLSTITAAIPMSNMNLFSDATTSGKHSDKNDNYKEFEAIILMMRVTTGQIMILIFDF